MSANASARNAPTAAEVQRIASLADPVIRNLRITECYHRLSAAMAERTRPCANWCTFATWASKQAGQTIRGEDLLDKLAALSAKDAGFLHPVRWFWGRLVRRGIFNPKTRLGRVVHAVHSPFDAFESASAAVARGNLKVFEEIGLEFARYLEECPPEVTVDSPEFQSFRKALREGAPPGGQGSLRLAFERYQQQAPGPAERARNIFLANIQIGFHEQTRLQPDIREAMESAPNTAEALGHLVLKALFPGIRSGRSIQLISALLYVPASRFRKYVRDLTRRVVTGNLMVLTLPSLVLDLHRDLDFPFPQTLQTIDDPILLQFLARFEPPAGGVDDCGAGDWSDLPQRVHFIIHLFRSFQERSDLFDAPFTAEQVRILMSGRVPAGDL